MDHWPVSNHSSVSASYIICTNISGFFLPIYFVVFSMLPYSITYSGQPFLQKMCIKGETTCSECPESCLTWYCVLCNSHFVWNKCVKWYTLAEIMTLHDGLSLAKCDHVTWILSSYWLQDSPDGQDSRLACAASLWLTSLHIWLICFAVKLCYSQTQLTM